MLQPGHDDYVTQEEMTERLDDVLKLYLKQKDEDMSGKVFFFICLFCFFLCNRLTNVSLYNRGTLVWITKGISVEGVRLCHRRQLVLLIRRDYVARAEVIPETNSLSTLLLKSYNVVMNDVGIRLDITSTDWFNFNCWSFFRCRAQKLL